MKLLHEMYNRVLNWFKPKPKKTLFPKPIIDIYCYGSYRNVIWIKSREEIKSRHYIVSNIHAIDSSILYILVRFIAAYPDGFTQIVNGKNYIVQLEGK